MIKYLIGIDPDVKKSGVALWNKELKNINAVNNLYFFELLEYITPTDVFGRGDYVVHIEAAWLHGKSNWHGGKGGIGHIIAKKVGANHQLGKLIEEYCIRQNINYKLIKPTAKKLNAKDFERITKYQGKTNQEQRDAAMLVFGL